MEILTTGCFSMPYEIQLSLNAKLVRDSSSGSTRIITDPNGNDFLYRGVKLGFHWKKYNSGENFVIGLKVSFPPDAIFDTVKLKYEISVIKNNKAVLSFGEHEFNFDIGNRYGNGPFDFDTHARVLTDSIYQDFTKNSDGTEKLDIVFKLISFDPIYTSSTVLKHLFTSLFPKNMVVTEISKLEDLLSTTEDEFTKIRAQHEIVSANLATELNMRDANRSRIATLKVENELMTTENRQFSEEMKGLQNRVEIMEKGITTCNLNDALLNFNPDKVDLHDFDLASLRELLNRLFTLQIKVVDYLLKENVCGLCLGETETCTIAKCGHFSYCSQCLQKNTKVECTVCSELVDLREAVQF